MILNSKMIKDLVIEKDMISNYIDLDTQLQPNGFDLTINIRSLSKMNNGFFAPVPSIDFGNTNRVLPKYNSVRLEDENWIALTVGSYAFVFNEFLKLPSNIMAECKPRSTMLRCFCDVRNAYWDRGFSGVSSGLLVVYEHCVLYQNARIAQMKFETLEDDGNVYDGIYKS